MPPLGISRLVAVKSTVLGTAVSPLPLREASACQTQPSMDTFGGNGPMPFGNTALCGPFVAAGEDAIAAAMLNSRTGPTSGGLAGADSRKSSWPAKLEALVATGE